MANTSNKGVYKDLKDSLGYTNEMERRSRKESKLKLTKLTIETKVPLMQKMRLWVWGYTNSEYLYMLHDGSLMLKHKTYTITSPDDALKA